MSDGSTSVSDAWGGDDLASGDPILPPCPVPLYYFPKPYPYSHNPVITSSLPRKLTPANPKLRVRIDNPWAQSMQLFVSDEPPKTRVSGNPKYATDVSIIHHPNLLDLRMKTYAAYTVFTRPGRRHVEPLAIPGSTFDFAWAAFSHMFEKRVGVKWTDIHGGWKQGKKVEDMLKTRLGGEDGATEHQLWDMKDPLTTARSASETNGQAHEEGETEEGIPSVTVVMSQMEMAADDHMEARAITPEEGW